MKLRCQQLLERRGGCWLGPLWSWSTSPMTWHRGMLSLRLPRWGEVEGLHDILPWIDAAFFVMHGWGGFRRVADFLKRCFVNHLSLDFRVQLREETLLEMLALLPETVCLRSLSFHWPLALLRRLSDD